MTYLDATMPDGSVGAIGGYGPDKDHAPYFVFDDETQDWIAGPYRWLWQARVAQLLGWRYD
jgi:hypothetical protein